MEMYLYRLMDFEMADEDVDSDSNQYVHVMETKVQSVIPLTYGYYSIGFNHIDIYPYYTATLPSKPITIFCGEEQESPEPYSLLFPCQSKNLAKEIFSGWLTANGYSQAAKAVKENAVTKLKRMSFPIYKEDVQYAKRLDKAKTLEWNDSVYRRWDKK